MVEILVVLRPWRNVLVGARYAQNLQLMLGETTMGTASTPRRPQFIQATALELGPFEYLAVFAEEVI